MPNFLRSFAVRRYPKTIKRNHANVSLVVKRRCNSSSTPLFQVHEVKEPRAVVLILGFGGAKPKHVAKYADMYKEKFNCSTVAGTVSNYNLFFHNDRALDDFALEAVGEVTRVLQSKSSIDNDGDDDGKPKTPVVIHSLSNGGAFVTARLGLMIDRVLYRKEDESLINNDYLLSMQLFSERLQKGYQIFDSAPCYINLKSSFSVIKHLIPNTYWLGVSAAAMYTLVYAIHCAISRPTKGELFWENLLKDTSCMKQGFIYTTCDDIADSEKIKEFIAAREELGVRVMVRHMEASDHVQHLRLYEKEYTKFIEMILTDMEDENRKSIV